MALYTLKKYSFKGELNKINIKLDKNTKTKQANNL